MSILRQSTLPIAVSSGCSSLRADTSLARLLLNLKGIPYKTEWIEYPDLAPTLKSFGIPPNPEGTAYTSPTIRIGDKYIMDSLKIATELEKQYPSPPLHVDSPLVSKVQNIVLGGIGSLRGVIMPRIPDKLLNQPSFDYWVASREAKYGMSLPQYAKEKGGDDAWEKAMPALKELGTILKAEGGPFVLGKTGKIPNPCMRGL